MEILIMAIGVFFLGFLIGLAIGSDDQLNTIQKAFEKEGYDRDRFNEVIHRIDN
jgi:hypothetical protein